MILRDDTGAVIFASCRFIPRCVSALEAKMADIMEGVTLALDNNMEHLVIETDCATTAHMITGQSSVIVNDVRYFLSLRSNEINIIRRNHTWASHALAHIGRTIPKTAVWLRCGPDKIEAIYKLDWSSDD